MNWIQKHALGVLLRAEECNLKDMRPEGVDSNLFSYHIHYLKSNGIIRSVARGKYTLTTKGMRVAGAFNSSTRSEAHDVKTVIILYARRGDDVALFEWSRHPYFGAMTLPHDRYNYGNSLQDALSEAVKDKLHNTLANVTPAYRKSGVVHIFHDNERISSMSAHVYTVLPEYISEQTTRNGVLRWVNIQDLAHTSAMEGLQSLVAQLEDDVTFFEATLTY